MAWDINSYIRVGALTFGMSPEETVPILGVAQTIFPAPSGAKEHLFGIKKPTLIFDREKLEEISFSPETDEAVLYNQVNLFGLSENKVLEYLWKASGKADTYEFVGFVVFFPLGIALSGYHDGDLEQKAASCFAKGRWDRFRSEMKSICF